MIAGWKAAAHRLKRDAYALSVAYRDPRTPWLARLVAAAVVAYALSPIDLIPDFVPILGYLDDLVLVPLGIALALRLMPAEVMADARVQADAALAQKPRLWTGAAAIVAAWLIVAAALGLAIWRRVAG